MAIVERFQLWYEHERDCNEKLLQMLRSVPDDRRGGPDWERALVLAAHLAACRENWLDRMTNEGKHQVSWWPDPPLLEDLPDRFASMEARWTAYFGGLTDEGLEADFEFSSGGAKYRWNIEGQIVQLHGHAPYHRGQIAMLVERLGGESVDTDYLYWAYQRDPRWGTVV